jgi:hypothetical protein
MRANQKQRRQQANQLLRLHKMRVRACEARYHEEKNKRDEAAEDVRQRQASITRLKNQHSDLFSYLDDVAVVESPLKVERMHTRRYWLEYDLEKDEYYLELDIQALNEADEEVAKAKGEWLRARYRESGAENMLKDTQKEIALAEEQGQELESEESRSESVLGGIL